jgi:hypothetical protein
MDYSKATNYCLDLIQYHLKLFIENVYMMEYGENNYKNYIYNEYYNMNNGQEFYTDCLFYMNFFISNYQILSKKLNSNYPLNLIYSLKYFRNRIAHQAQISMRQIYRFIDETQALLEELNTASQEEIFKLEAGRKEIMKFMLNCNDNIIVMGKEKFNNNYNDFETDMKDQFNENIKIIKEIQNLYSQQEKINFNYQRIMNNNDMNNFHKVSNLEDKNYDE